MSYFKAVFDTGRPLSVKVPEEREIYSRMSVDPLFVDPPVPYPDFLNALDAQDLAIQKAEFGGVERTANMRTKAREVDEIIRQMKGYVSLAAKGSIDLILSSGFKHTKPRASAGDMPKVAGLRRLQTDVSGELKLRWAVVKNVGFYEVQVRVVAEGEATPTGPADADTSDSWQSHVAKPASISIQGLEPLLQYAVRVRAKGAKGFGGFSDVLVVLVT